MLDRWRDDDIVAAPDPPRRERALGLLRGPAHRQRPARHPPRVGPPVQGPLPPLPHHAGQARARKGGWDCHGLPVEVEVEKELGLLGQARDRGLRDRRVQRSAAASRCSATSTTGRRSPTRIGMWLDTDDAYWTLDNDYIERVWWLLRQMWDEGRLYEGHKVVALLRALRHRAVEPRARPARRVPRRHRAVGLRALPRGRRRRRPARVDDHARGRWSPTSPPPSAPTSSYVRVARPPAASVDLVVAGPPRCSATTPRSSARSTGADLVGLRYERPFDLLPPDPAPARWPWSPPTSSPSTTARASCTSPPRSARSTARSAGPRACRVLNPVGPDGALRRPGATATPGRFVKDADPRHHRRPRRTRPAGARAAPTTHSYPHCWRCGTPLIYWAKPTWFARTVRAPRRAARARTSRSAGTPSTSSTAASATGSRTTSTGRCPATATGARRCPVWRCDDCGHDTCVGSVAELARARRRDLAEPRPAPPVRRRHHHRLPPTAATRHARRASSRCSTPGSTRARCPSAQHHYPFADGAEARSTRRFPADFICEAIDQTRGWFYSLLAVNTLVFDETPYRNVVCLALVVDEDGQKMSKSKGNVIDPWDVLDTRGADALRWYFFSPGQPWTPRRVSEDGIDESTRQFLLTLWNSYSFFVTYANLDGWAPAGRRRRRADPRARPVDPLAARRHDRRGHRRARGLRRAAAARRRSAVRRRPLELVRAPVAAAVLEGVRRRRPRHAPRVPRHHRAAARAVLPVRRRRDAPQPHRRAESVHLADWPDRRAATTPPSPRRWPRPAAWSPRPRRPHRRQDQGPPAPRAGPAPARRRRPRRRRRRRDRRRAQREAARAHRHPLGPHALDRGAQLPHPRPPPRARRSTR